jgi:hypothetical protein
MTLHNEFNENLPVGSEVCVWDRQSHETHRQDGNVISLYFFFKKEIRLKEEYLSVN